jgi:hypothetical protein
VFHAASRKPGRASSAQVDRAAPNEHLNDRQLLTYQLLARGLELLFLICMLAVKGVILPSACF